MDKEYLRLAAIDVAKRLPDQHGFVLFTTPTGHQPGRVGYVANVNRQDAIKMVKEWLFAMGEGENWMKHIK